MKIDINQRLKNNIFYNNICLIVCLFCIICFFTSINLEHTVEKEKTYDLQENSMVGPIEITDKSAIYYIKAYFGGFNTSNYISGEVLNEEQDTLYEFGKDLWHEEGYDSEGHWSESDRVMSANLTFSEKGKYYLQFHTEENNMDKIKITIKRMQASDIPHLEAGIIFFIIILILWLKVNWDWFLEVFNELNEKLLDAMED